MKVNGEFVLVAGGALGLGAAIVREFAGAVARWSSRISPSSAVV